MYYHIEIYVLIAIVAILIGILLWNAGRYPYLIIQKSPKGGRGVYANIYFKKGSIIEICPLLISKNKKLGDAVTNYSFNYETIKKDHGAIALGYGSLYNHNDNPNAEYEVRYQKLIIKASRDIRPGDEIFISYGDDWWTTRNMHKVTD